MQYFHCYFPTYKYNFPLCTVDFLTTRKIKKLLLECTIFYHLDPICNQ